jgi:membrane fusion protein (multidrug efflux system)
MISRKKIAGLSVLVLGALLFMAWLAGLLHFGKIAPGLVPIKGAPAPGQILVVQETAIPQELEVLGAVISKSLAQISSQVPGRVAKIWVEAGSRVKMGDPLVSLAAAEYQARLSQAQAQLNQAAADYKRYQFLLKEGAASPQEFGAMEARYKTAKAQVAEAATMTGYTVVKATSPGVVAERQAAVGDVAQPGQVLVTLYNPKLLQIEGEVNDSYRDTVKLGEMAQVTVPAVQFQADLPLTEIFPISAVGSRTFKVRTAMIRDSKLTPGMFARLRLPLGTTRGLLIPKSAVETVGQLTMVKVVQDKVAELRQVKLGRTVGEKVEVLAGLKAGDRVVQP